MKSSPQARRIPSMIRRDRRVRFVSEPPQSSVRRFDQGVQN